MAKTIKITMRHGKPVIVAEGFEGDECLEATKNVEEALAGEGGVEIREEDGTLVSEEQYLRITR